jgi:hypothetical protein
MDIEALLKSPGRDVMSDNSAKHLAKHAGQLSPLVAACSAEARERLGDGASADALARATALGLLRRIAHVPVKARAVDAADKADAVEGE